MSYLFKEDKFSIYKKETGYNDVHKNKISTFISDYNRN